LALGIQLLLWAAWFLDVVFQKHSDAFQRGVELLYTPVNWLTDALVENTEANIGAGFLFVPPVILLYAVVFAALAGTARKCFDT